MIEMRESVYIVTGANGGLGFQTVKQLLIEHKLKHRERSDNRASIHTIDELSWDNSSYSSSFDLTSENREVSIAIVLACRKIEAAYETIKLLSDDIPADGSVRMHPMKLDLGDSVSVQTFASDVSSQFRQVDCLICNAGVLVPNVPNVIETDCESNQIDENEEETAVWYQESNEQSAQSQVGVRGDRSPIIEVGEMSYSDVILANEEKRKKEKSETDKQKFVTTDGHEINVGVNHLGHFLLVNLLLDQLKKSRSSRVVIVSSILLKNASLNLSLLKNRSKIKLLKTARAQTQSRLSNSSETLIHRRSRTIEDFSKKDPKENYNESKLMNALFTRELDRRLKKGGIENVSIYCVSPGWCKTSLHRNTDLPWYAYILALPVAALFMKSAKEGCRTIVHCATEDANKLISGRFYRNKIVDEGIETFLDSKFTHQNCEDLFNRSLAAVGLPQNMLSTD